MTAHTEAARIVEILPELVKDSRFNQMLMLENMLSSYDTLKTENDQLTSEMELQKQQIEELMTKVKRGGYDLAKAKKEAEKTSEAHNPCSCGHHAMRSAVPSCPTRGQINAHV